MFLNSSFSYTRSFTYIFFVTLFTMNVVYSSALLEVFRFVLTFTNCDLRELKGLWTILTSCDFNALSGVGVPEKPLMYGTEEYILFSLRDSSDSLVPDSVFDIVSMHPIWIVVSFQGLLNILNFMCSVIFFRNQGHSSK